MFLQPTSTQFREPKSIRLDGAERSAAKSPTSRSAKSLRQPNSECIARKWRLLTPKTLSPDWWPHPSVIRWRTEAAPVSGTRSPMPTTHGQWQPTEDLVLVSLSRLRARNRRLHCLTLPGLEPGRTAECPRWTRVLAGLVAPAKEESGRSRRAEAPAVTGLCLRRRQEHICLQRASEVVKHRVCPGTYRHRHLQRSLPELPFAGAE